MKKSPFHFVGPLSSIFLALILGISRAASADDSHDHFDVNDICFLWPVATSPTDVANLISIDDPISPGGPPILPSDLFQTLITTATSSVSVNRGNSAVQIFFPDNGMTNPHNWKITGIRVDPSAPGVDPAITAIFGSRPQIRIIIQPVTVDSDGNVKVQDFTAHLVFDYGNIPEAVRKADPEKDPFNEILTQLKQIKASVKVPTAGLLSVHPGFKADLKGLTGELRTFIGKNVSRNNLAAMAMIGIQSPEPWIFFTLARQSDGTFALFHDPSLNNQTAEMFAFDSPHVLPTPITTNPGNVSTSMVFDSSGLGGFDLPVNILDSAISPSAQAPDHQAINLRDIPAIIANPTTSHFFNTDCVSCHTESSRRASTGMSEFNESLAYQVPAGISGIDPSMLPRATDNNWDLRNFGWFPSAFTGEVRATITQRTANEAAAAADYINRIYFAQNTAHPASNSVPTDTAAPTATVAPSPAASAIPTPSTTPPESVSHALTLVMKIKSKNDLQELVDLLNPSTVGNPSSKVTQTQITQAMNNIGNVHFARFVILPDQMELMVITDYDGPFNVYIDSFTHDIGSIFDALLTHMDGAPPLPVEQNEAAFLKYVHDNDKSSGQSSYSAYPDLTVQDILTLRKNALQTQATK